MDRPQNEPTQIEFDSGAEENAATDKEAPRRVITDTGDIIEAPEDVKKEQNTSKFIFTVLVTKDGRDFDHWDGHHNFLLYRPKSLINVNKIYLLPQL